MIRLHGAVSFRRRKKPIVTVVDQVGISSWSYQEKMVTSYNQYSHLDSFRRSTNYFKLLAWKDNLSAFKIQYCQVSVDCQTNSWSFDSRNGKSTSSKSGQPGYWAEAYQPWTKTKQDYYKFYTNDLKLGEITISLILEFILAAGRSTWHLDKEACTDSSQALCVDHRLLDRIWLRAAASQGAEHPWSMSSENCLVVTSRVTIP